MTETMLQLEEECVLLDIQARSKEGVLREMAEALQVQCPQVRLEDLCQVLHEREQIGSTGVGSGVALPHGKVKGLERIHYCFGRSQEGISFDSIDNQPVHFVFMILSPLDVAEEYLKTLARASRLLKQPERRRQLRQAATKQEIIALFQQA